MITLAFYFSEFNEKNFEVFNLLILGNIFFIVFALNGGKNS